jgi:SAM-dependent methyltransferase
MAEESNRGTVGGIDQHILPLVKGIEDRLKQGIDVADIGCGKGLAILHLARRFPRSRFVGIDLSADATNFARAEAERRGLTNAHFVRRDLTHLAEPAQFDLITAFDAIHDQARPDLVLAHIHRALRAGGVFLMQDIKASSHVEKNLDHPMAPFIYTISCMHCMSVSLAQGGMGLGAAWGEELARKMLAEAGFGQVEVHQLPHDILNSYYVCRHG